VAVVIGPPDTCSGLAYSGVMRRCPVRVRGGANGAPAPSSDFAIPKSTSFTTPSVETRMFDGLRSRCTIRLRCAKCTARAAVQNSRSRSSTPSRRWSQCASIGAPATYSITQYGRPSAVVPPSRRPTMFACASRATIWRSAMKRRTSASESGWPRKACVSLIATRWWNCPSSRSAR
jgi:hypothetical protein